MADAEVSQGISEPVICKYCHATREEATSALVNTCMCTDPVCLDCLKMRIESTNCSNCEICKSTHQITDDMNINTSTVISINGNNASSDSDNAPTVCGFWCGIACAIFLISTFGLILILYILAGECDDADIATDDDNSSSDISNNKCDQFVLFGGMFLLCPGLALIAALITRLCKYGFDRA